MSRLVRSGFSKPIATLIVFAALTLLPFSAFAEHESRRDRHREHGRHETCPMHAGHHDHAVSHRWLRFRPPVRHRPFREVSHRQQQAESFRCRPCSSHFESRRELYRHLVRHHHVPVWYLPFALLHHGMSWVFYG